MMVVKGRFRLEGEYLHGLVLLVADPAARSLARTRAVLSYQPSVFATSPGLEAFEFEKRLYACRLWEGSLQELTLALEGGLAAALERDTEFWRALVAGGEPFQACLARAVQAALRDLRFQWEAGGFRGEFRAEPLAGLGPAKAGGGPAEMKLGAGAMGGTPLVLRIALEGDPDGAEAGALKTGDVVFAQILDNRDIALYLAKLFGGLGKAGLQAVPVPVESVEEAETEARVVRVRFSPGAVGEAHLPTGVRVRASAGSRGGSWWVRLFSKKGAAAY